MLFLLDILMWILPSLIVGWLLPQPKWAADIQARIKEWLKNRLFG